MILSGPYVVMEKRRGSYARMHGKYEMAFFPGELRLEALLNIRTYAGRRAIIAG
jgi:hypothetical protein